MYSSILRNAKYYHKTEEQYSLLLECKHHIIHVTIQRYLFLLIHIYPQSQEMLAQKNNHSSHIKTTDINMYNLRRCASILNWKYFKT